MSLLSKTFSAIGEKKTINGVTQSTLPKVVDDGLKTAFDGIRGAVVNVIQNVDWAANQALVTIIYEPTKAISNAVKEVREIKKGGKQ